MPKDLAALARLREQDRQDAERRIRLAMILGPDAPKRDDVEKLSVVAPYAKGRRRSPRRK